ncbi:MAG: hypothetical protein ABSB28_06410 [Candidatus Bathyarchaeia archaeon]
MLYRVRHPEPPMLILDGITFAGQRAGTFSSFLKQCRVSCPATDKYVMVV